MELILIGLMAALLVGIGTALFQWLWNITMPDVFDLPAISFWVAFRILLIAGFLTSGGFIKFNINR